MSKTLIALGLMSGTSMDGVDAAIIRTDGEGYVSIPEENFLTLPYSSDFKEKLRAIIDGRVDSEGLAKVEEDLTYIHAEAVEKLLAKAGMMASDVDIIGFHGHTIDHRPRDRITRQIGNGKLLAALTKINVVNDFRSADVEAGGEGAPLVPLYHAALFAKFPKPLAVLNIGGVANVTYLDDEAIIAFDTGTGCAMIDDLVFAATGKSYDEGGEIAAKGSIDEGILEALLSDEYFSQKPPKSLDRNDFILDSLTLSQREKGRESLSLEDSAATLAAFTAKSVAMGCKFLPKEPESWYITGGGRYNKTIMSILSEYLSGDVYTIDSIPPLAPPSRGGGLKDATPNPSFKGRGISHNSTLNGDSLEAEAFAYLAVRSLYNLPLSLPSTTGVKKSSVTGGVFYQA